MTPSPLSHTVSLFTNRVMVCRAKVIPVPPHSVLTFAAK